MAVRFDCRDCGVDTVPFDGPCEYYNLHNDLWEAIGMKRNGGMLCIGCVERRLGRLLNRADFTGAPVNSLDPKWHHSDRLIDRLTTYLVWRPL
jgi:hypothetical protein